MKAEIYSQDGKLIRAVNATNYQILPNHVDILFNGETMAIVPNTYAIIFVDDNTPSKWPDGNKV